MEKIITFVFLTLLSCSKDSPVPDAVVPAPTLTFTTAVTASEGGSVNDPGDTHNENANVSLTATPADGYAFSGWSPNIDQFESLFNEWKMNRNLRDIIFL